jgi:hypothetical protein
LHGARGHNSDYEPVLPHSFGRVQIYDRDHRDGLELEEIPCAS